jgi:1-acyl-sn-glycerol-3-phosphate acyltransferase
MWRAVGRAFLFCFGWTCDSQAPTPARYVLVAAPHTSNWDFPFTIAIAAALGIRLRWMGKHTLFRFPFGWFMRLLGGIPVERHRRGNMVDAQIDVLVNATRLALMVPAEGTRARVAYWKSGFYHIARGAGVPIVLGYLDYPKRRGGFGPPLDASEEVGAVMARVRAFYDDKTGRFPEKFAVPRLREEDDVAVRAAR